VPPAGSGWPGSWPCAQSLDLNKLCCVETSRGLALARRLGDRRAEGLHLRVLGLGLGGLGLPWAGMRRCGQALAIARELTEPGREIQALGIFEDRGDRYGQATCLLKLGELHQAAGRAGQALGCLERCLAIAVELGLSAVEARARRAAQECEPSRACRGPV
jgi:hypothetical protein